MSLPRMYADLARWWPLLSPPQEYVEEAAMIGGLLRTGGREVSTVLELGSGGGHNAVHLRESFEMTLVDLSEQMLEVSRRLNPGCEHVAADMRTARLERRFDAVVVHDALDYIVSEDDLTAVFATAAAHLEPGGVLVLVPDHVRETFEPRTEHGGTDGPDGSGIRYLEWTYDPDPADDWVVAEFGYLMRESDGSVTSAAETHRFGLFSQQRWIDLLREAGFEVTTLEEQTEDEQTGRVLFVATIC
ncbi:MAG: methyltransferase domain-containing protein [Ornithinimicrobium sp.]|jgi:SAM-dependent methyltransferase|uniref:methyltransferase domain-containing protein n=1 Tax=Ornithinimicrobium sp. TaxID=1977084 RepID=UPI003D9B06E1